MEIQFLDASPRSKKSKENKYMEHTKDRGSKSRPHLRERYILISIMIFWWTTWQSLTCPFSALFPPAPSQDKGPLKKVIKDKKSKVKTTRPKLGQSLFWNFRGLVVFTVCYFLRPIPKERWNHRVLRFQRFKGYTVQNLRNSKCDCDNCLFVAATLFYKSLAEGIPERTRQGIGENLEGKQYTRNTYGMPTTKTWPWSIPVRTSSFFEAWTGRHLAWCQASRLLHVPLEE